MTLPAASRTPVSHSSNSAAEFGAQDLLGPLRQLRVGLERSEGRQVPAAAPLDVQTAADQLQGRPQLSLRELNPAVSDAPGEYVLG